MEYSLANRIFMIFPDKLSQIILLRYELRDNIRARAERSWAKSKDALSGGMLYYYTINYCHVIQFFDSLENKCFFPSHPSIFLSSQQCCVVVVFAVSFLSALTFAGPEKYLILILVNYL